MTRTLFKIINILTATLFLFCAVSCDMINTPVKEFFTGSLEALSSNNQNNSNESNNSSGSNPSDDSGNSDKTSAGEEDSGNSPADGPEPDASEESPVTAEDDAFDNIDENISFVFYVSDQGDDDNDGSMENPFLTIDNALKALRQSFNADTEKSKSAGYVLLLSDININAEIDFNSPDYRFAEIAPAVDITIGGYKTKRTINAAFGSRIFKIGWTNGNITIQNLTLTGGYSMDVGGAAFYITSTDSATDFSSKKFLIKNCVITDNMSDLPGGALALETAYKVEIENCEITNNTSFDGPSVCDLKTPSGLSAGIGICLKNTLIKENYSHTGSSSSLSSYEYGYVINTEGTRYARFDGGVTVKDNTIDSIPAGKDYSKLAAVNNAYGIEFSGKNIITDNKAVISGSGSNSIGIEKNLIIVPDAASAAKILYMQGNCDGSKIGVNLSSAITDSIKFTNGFKASGTSSAPAEIFVSDGAYAVDWDSSGSEAAFVLNSGSFINPLGITMTFTASPVVLTAGKAGKITVSPHVLYEGSDVTDTLADDISWSLSLTEGSATVAVCNSNILNLTASQTLPDTYQLFITAVLNGIVYDDSVTIECIEE